MAESHTAGALRAGYAQGRRLASGWRDRARKTVTFRTAAVGATRNGDVDDRPVNRPQTQAGAAVACRRSATEGARATGGDRLGGDHARAVQRLAAQSDTHRQGGLPADSHALGGRVHDAGRGGAPATVFGATPSAGGLGAGNEMPGAIGTSGGAGGVGLAVFLGGDGDAPAPA